MSRKFPNNAESSRDAENVIPVAVVGFFGDVAADGDESQAVPIWIKGSDVSLGGGEGGGGSGEEDMVVVLTAGAAAVDAEVFRQDMTGLAGVAVQVTGPFVGTLIFESSNDETTWQTSPAIGQLLSSRVNSITGVGMYYAFSAAKFLRLRMTARTSGTANAVAFGLMKKGLVAGAVEILANGVSLASPAGDNADGLGAITTGILRVQAVIREWNGQFYDRKRKANKTYRLLSSAAAGNPAFVQAAGGDIKTVWGENTTGGIVYVHFYNKATAPVLGTDTPLISYAVQAGSYFELPLPQDGGFYFPAGIAIAFTTDNVTIPATGAAAGAITNFCILYA